MCVGQVSSRTIAPDVSIYANQTDQRVLIQIMLRHNSARQICSRLHMSGLRFRQIQQTGVITDRIANRLNQIEGMEIFKPNHPRLGGQRSKEKAWNDEHQFKPDSQYFRLFVEYFVEWAFRGRKLGE